MYCFSNSLNSSSTEILSDYDPSTFIPNKGKKQKPDIFLFLFHNVIFILLLEVRGAQTRQKLRCCHIFHFRGKPCTNPKNSMLTNYEDRAHIEIDTQSLRELYILIDENLSKCNRRTCVSLKENNLQWNTMISCSFGVRIILYMFI